VNIVVVFYSHTHTHTYINKCIYIYIGTDIPKISSRRLTYRASSKFFTWLMECKKKSMCDYI
jgi:hypothetical protein